MSYLLVDNIAHRYAGRQTLNGVSFALNRGEISSLMGPSGSGKTTVLLCIAGLEKIMDGSIQLGDSILSSNTKHVQPEKRKVGMVFQDFALFPHLSVADNIGFGLRGLDASEKQNTIASMLELCGLVEYASVYPHELSGGEQQRVALARAMATNPDVLLLDEPFSRLDPKLHEKISREVRDILKSREQTTLVVTHNQNEAFLLADSGGVINEGAICQWDSMDDLYHRPRCTFVAEFVGDGTLLEGKMQSDGAVEVSLGVLRGDSKQNYPLIRAGDSVKVLLRPDDILLDSERGVPAVIERRVFRGATSLYSLRLQNGEQVTSVWSSQHQYELGAAIPIRAQVRHLILFPSLGSE